MHSINAHGQLLDLSEPRVMGILNITPDSFYAGSRVNSENEALQRVEMMIREGACFIDVGGYSSRPGADHIDVQTELHRVNPVISAIRNAFPQVIISIDTFRADVAKEALNRGAQIVNDISGGLADAHMPAFIAEKQVPYVCMHMRGNPQTMQQQTAYNDLVAVVWAELYNRVTWLKRKGIHDIIADPGFGFAKTAEQNHKLVKSFSVFKTLGVPLLAGISRKSFIYKSQGLTPDDALPATTEIHRQLLNSGVNILRVHDVKPAVECIKAFVCQRP